MGRTTRLTLSPVACIDCYRQRLCRVDASARLAVVSENAAQPVNAPLEDPVCGDVQRRKMALRQVHGTQPQPRSERPLAPPRRTLRTHLLQVGLPTPADEIPEDFFSPEIP